jgi:hypothetical protein
MAQESRSTNVPEAGEKAPLALRAAVQEPEEHEPEQVARVLLSIR